MIKAGHHRVVASCCRLVVLSRALRRTSGRDFALLQVLRQMPVCIPCSFWRAARKQGMFAFSEESVALVGVAGSPSGAGHLADNVGKTQLVHPPWTVVKVDALRLASMPLMGDAAKTPFTLRQAQGERGFCGVKSGFQADPRYRD
jgi:hypothetical protein